MDEAVRARMKKIEPGAFSSLERGPWRSRFGKHPACCEVLSNATLIFGVSLYRLGFLLGTSQVGKIYQWMSCESKPSSKYLLRLVRLHQLQLAGLDLGVVRAINWDSGVVRFHPVLDISTGKFVEKTSESLPGEVQERDVLSEWKERTPSWV